MFIITETGRKYEGQLYEVEYTRLLYFRSETTTRHVIANSKKEALELIQNYDADYKEFVENISTIEIKHISDDIYFDRFKELGTVTEEV